MPKSIRVPFLNEEVVAAVQGLGINEARVGLLHALLQRRSATGPELAEDTGISTQMVSHHLRHMEQHGLVHADRERRTRGGPAVTWTADHDALRRDLKMVERLILPPKA